MKRLPHSTSSRSRSQVSATIQRMVVIEQRDHLARLVDHKAGIVLGVSSDPALLERTRIFLT